MLNYEQAKIYKGNKRPIAIVDIGSNSVRLVIFDEAKRVPMTSFNEKLLCGMARDLENTKKLNPDALNLAKKSINRFLCLCDLINVDNVSILATSAVRDAEDGPDFVKYIKDKFDVQTEVVSGKQEAYYAASGVISSIYDVDGVIGDLGGGSLELMSIKNREIQGDPISLPLGPLRIMSKKGFSRRNANKLIDSHLEKFDFENLKNKSFYAVGGSLRNLAKIHMGRRKYPIKVINNYKVETEEFLETLEIVSKMEESALKKLPYITTKRREVLPVAAIIAKRIIKIGNPQNIIFSSNGIREGYIYDNLSKGDKTQDPLIFGCIEINRMLSRSLKYSFDLFEWLEPIFDEENQNQRRLRLACCILVDISIYENVEYRAEIAFKKIIDSSLSGLNHYERVYIAKALFHRYSVDEDKEILEPIQSMLLDSSKNYARSIGAAMKLAQSIAAAHEDILSKTRLENTKKLRLYINKEIDSLQGEQLAKRLAQLAVLLGKKSEIIIE